MSNDENTVDEITVVWRAPFDNAEIHALHAEAFQTRLYDESEWDWVALCRAHSLGWVVARDGDRFVGFVNVLWDGLVHAFIEDVMVDVSVRHRGIGVRLVHAARDGARSAGCDFLHVGFEDDLAGFYLDACGFSPTAGGLMDLSVSPTEVEPG
ncbi:MAG: GNAT family N-acetyltransferase [Ilumatobacteraceae bacterium]